MGCWCHFALAQNLEFSVSPTPVGSGARAAGMADAFVAVADDATAASWNPAGLVQLERPELSIVGELTALEEEFSSSRHRETNSSHHDDAHELNYFSLVYPLPVLIGDRNASVSLNYQRKYDFNRQFGIRYNLRGTGLNAAYSRYNFDYEQDGGLSALTPAVAMELTQRLSVGVSVNFWRSSLFDDNDWEQHVETHVFSQFGDLSVVSRNEIIEKYEDFSGENITLGVLWNVFDKWNVGLRYDSSFEGEAEYTYWEFGYDVGLPTLSYPVFMPAAYARVESEDRHLRFPASLALGAAYRPNDRLTVSLDITQTDWNEFYYKNGRGHRFSLVNGMSTNTAPDFDKTKTVRLGAEYLFLPKQPDETLKRLWSLRGGLFYDEEPASREPDSFYGFALGAGLQTHQRVNLDVAYQLRYGDDVNEDLISGIDDFQEDVLQHRFLFSTVIYF